MSSLPARKWTSSELIIGTLSILGVALGFWGFYQLRWGLFILFTAIIISTALAPLSNKLQHWGLPPIFAVMLLYLGLLLLFIGLMIFFTPLLLTQIVAIIDTAPTYYQEFRSTLVQSPNLFLQQLSWRLPPELALSNLVSTVQVNEISNFSRVYETVALGVKGVFTTVATLLLSVFWTLEGERAIRTMLLILPTSHRDGARELVQEIQNKVGAYVRGQAILCLIIGVLALIAYVWIGVPYAMALAVFAGLMEAVPYLGPVLGAIPAVLIAASVDVTLAAWVIGASVVIQQIENTFLIPRIMNQAVGVNPLVALLAIFSFGSLFGIVGVLLAIPIAAILQTLMDRFVFKPLAINQLDGDERGGLSRLRYHLKELIFDVQKQARQGETGPMESTEHIFEETIEAIAADLDSLLAQRHNEAKFIE
jgi:predicted PurR-regulated permease PerM